MKRIPLWTPELVEAAAKGEPRIYRGTLELPYRLNASERRAFERAKQTGYLVEPSRTTRLSLNNVWDKWCEATHTIYVLARLRIRYAEIHVDMLVTSEVIAATGCEELDQLARRFDRDRADRGPAFCSPRSCVLFALRKVSREHIDEAARALAAIAQHHRRLSCIDDALQSGLTRPLPGARS